MTVFTRLFNQHHQRGSLRRLLWAWLAHIAHSIQAFKMKLDQADTQSNNVSPSLAQPAWLTSLVDGSMMLTAEGKIADCSSSFAALCGYPAQALIGCHLRVLMPDFYHHDTQTLLADYVAMASTTGMPSWRQTWLQCLDGRRLTVRVHVVATPTIATNQYLLLMNDVTAQVAAQLGQQQQAAWCAHVLQQLAGVQFRCEASAERRLLSLDANISQLTGWPMSTFLTGNLPFWQCIVQEDRARQAQVMCQAINLQQGYQLEYRMRDRQGNQRWIKEIGHPVCDSNGLVICVEGALFDVTLQHQQTVQQQGMLDALQQSIPMARLTNCGIFMDATQPFLSQLGLRAWDIQGQPHQVIQSAQPQEAPFQSQMWAQLSQGIAIEKNLYYDHPNGESYVMHVHYLPVLDSQHQYSQVLMCLGVLQTTSAILPSQGLRLVPTAKGRAPLAHRPS